MEYEVDGQKSPGYPTTAFRGICQRARTREEGLSHGGSQTRHTKGESTEGDPARSQNRLPHVKLHGDPVLSRAAGLSAQALAHSRSGAWDQATTCLARARESSPSGTTWLQVALGYMELEDPEEAGRALAAAEAELGSNPALHVFRALLACDNEDWEQARRDWWAARSLSPANQAVPSVQALRYLGEGRIEEALRILYPDGSTRPFDLTVSPPAIGRLAVALERRLLPLELPDPDGQQDSQIEPPAPSGPAVLLFRRGRGRLEKAWRLAEAERAPQILLALAELRAAHQRDPKAFRASYHLGEALLSAAEYARDRQDRPGPESLARIREAEACFEESRRDDGTNPYVLHYLARCALLQRRFSRASDLWREALQGFEKFPEAHYGLGQALLARGQRREARRYLLQSILSDLHLLRDRIADLTRLYRAHPDLFTQVPDYPIPEASTAEEPEPPPVAPPPPAPDGETVAPAPEPAS